VSRGAGLLLSPRLEVRLDALSKEMPIGCRFHDLWLSTGQAGSGGRRRLLNSCKSTRHPEARLALFASAPRAFQAAGPMRSVTRGLAPLTASSLSEDSRHQEPVGAVRNVPSQESCRKE